MTDRRDHAPADIRLHRGLAARRTAPREVHGTDCERRLRVGAGCPGVPITRSGRSP